MNGHEKFWCSVVAFLGVFFIVDDNSYKEVLWFFIWAPISAVVLGYCSLRTICNGWRCNMKLKDDILERFESGENIYEIAKAYNTTPVEILKILGLEDTAI